ncbi:hypothetical protein P3T76_003573 [Phytophthora citrophthora]|uniref:Uncharacterized protein n=1 Tax=Phytophthora citrophthora TaxID=4793 RepID=A0AAD9GUB5_9STRA|nr:hypothetical protein P3T76_003573 [Phytophthora citrophthora]
MAGAPWTSEELVLLPRSFAEVGSPSATSAQKFVGVTQIYPVFVRLADRERTKCSVESTARSMLRARTVVLGKYTWPEWLAFPEQQRHFQARLCPATYRSILMHMNREVFQILDQVAARDSQVLNTTASAVQPVERPQEPNLGSESELNEPNLQDVGVPRVLPTGEEDLDRILSVLSETVPRIVARHMDDEEIHAALLEILKRLQPQA